MDDDSGASTAPKPKRPFILFNLWQWIVAGFFLLVLLLALAEFKKLGLPGAPVTQFWIAFVGIGLMAIAHSPPVFFRVPILARLGLYAGALTIPAIYGDYLTRIEPIWARTPEGAKEMAELADREKREAQARAIEARVEADRQKSDRVFAEAEETGRQIEAMQRRLESCFSWSHQLPTLSNAVKESLHNPSSFEHVESVLIVPDDDRNNVAMTFRAENGFGAIRTAVVKAQLVADGCVVQNVGEPSELQ